MAGGQTNARNVVDVITAYSFSAVTLFQFLTEYVVLFPCEITAVKVYAVTAGTGVGSTIITIQKNGTSIWQNSASRPTLAATSTGEFTNTKPTTSGLQPGDLITIEVASISSTGHGRLMVSVALERVR